MIPKIIHYCWFGRSPKPELIEKCIASWHKFCPDWEIIEWNEDNWNVDAYQYAREAYDAGKWAFVSDVARLDVLSKRGGVYLDTDVEILKEHPFEQYMGFKTVMCFENARGISTGLFFAAEKNSEICRRFIYPYTEIGYSEKTRITNTGMNEPVIREYLPSLKWNGETQVLGDICVLGCEEHGALIKHYGTRSWCDNLPAYKVSGSSALKRVLRKPEIFETLESSKLGRKVLPLYTFLSYDLLDCGPVFYLKLFYNNHLKPKGKKHE